jgi:hypothetical protein
LHLADHAQVPGGAAFDLGALGVSPDDVLALQRQAGNAALGKLMAESKPITLFRQVPPVAPPPAVLAGATPLDRADDGFKQATPGALDQAWGIMNSRAMFDLLPLLVGMKARGHWAAISAGAAGRGGPRMENAVHTVNLKTKGSPVTKQDLRDLIDRMATMNPDQRADMLRFLGKLVVITIDGIDLDISYVAGATTESAAVPVKEAIAEARFFINEYAATLRNKKVKSGADVEKAVEASLAKQGMGIVVAGSTSSTGAISIAPQPMTKAQPILIRTTEIHEGVHQHHVAQLQKTFGKKTAAFDKAFNDAKDWVSDEINARRAEIKFLGKVLGALKQLERMVK